VIHLRGLVEINIGDMINILNDQILCAIIQTVLHKRLLVPAMILSLKKRKYKKKKCWVSNFLIQRNMNGAYNITIPELLRDFDSFTNYCRMTRTQLK